MTAEETVLITGTWRHWSHLVLIRELDSANRMAYLTWMK